MNKTVIIAIIALVAAILLAIPVISFSNKEIDLRNKFEATVLARTSFYDNMHKTISAKVQISSKVDESFKENINSIMEGRKDSDQIMWKWVQEVNPNANFSEVSDLYKDLSRTIEAKRDEFVNRETLLADLQREHKSLIMLFPNSFINMFLGRKPLELKIIQSETTQQVMETGIDNETDLGL